MPSRSTSVAVLACVVTTAACDDSDIGRPCPSLLVEAGAGGAADGRLETQEVIGYDPTFPCEEMICVATAGRAGYCSKQCREDGGCPDGFECRVVQPVGQFAGEKFCVWKACDRAGDCGKKGEFCCRSVTGAESPAAEKFCDFAKDDKCG